jgi:hypothetical protein
MALVENSTNRRLANNERMPRSAKDL